MRYRIEHRPSYPVLKIELAPGETLDAEAGAMMTMLGDVEVKTHAKGGMLASLARKIFAAESFFINTFTAFPVGRGAEIQLVPPYPGDIEYIPLDGVDYIIQDTSYLASHGDVELTVAWRGLRGLFAEGELVWLKASGYGGVWVTAFGAITRMDIPPGEVATIDNLHFVAMPADIDWSMKRFGGVKSFLLGGEGVVFEVRGPAALYLQTRVLQPFAQMLYRFMPKSRR